MLNAWERSDELASDCAHKIVEKLLGDNHSEQTKTKRSYDSAKF